LYSLPAGIGSILETMEHQKPIAEDGKGKRSVVGSILVGLFGALGVVYLINPTAGFLELIPDNLPVVGNLDEAAAMMLVISCLAYFGIDLGGLFGRKPKKDDIIDVEVVDK
jgi:hypothetical protein